MAWSQQIYLIIENIPVSKCGPLIIGLGDIVKWEKARYRYWKFRDNDSLKVTVIDGVVHPNRKHSSHAWNKNISFTQQRILKQKKRPLKNKNFAKK
jgi:hypothetical protein